MSDRDFGSNRAGGAAPESEPNRRGARIAIAAAGGIFGVAALGALGIWLEIKFKNRLSDDQATQLVLTQIDTSDQQICLNPVKVKYAANNEPVSFGPPPAPQAPPADAVASPAQAAAPDQAAGAPPDAATNNAAADNASPAANGGAQANDANAQANEANAQTNTQPNADQNAANPPPAQAAAPAPTPATVAPPPSSNGFPLVLAEEWMLPWKANEKFVMSLLAGGGYIAVHSGGYPESKTQPGTPGAPFRASSPADVASIVAAIAQRGAQIDLTDKGRAAHVWEPPGGFCMSGHWTVSGVAISGLREIPGNRALAHISAKVSLAPKQLGQATANLNPLNLDFGEQDEFDALRDAQGWHIVAPNDPILSETSQSASSDGSFLSGLLGMAMVHEMMKDEDDKDGAAKDEDSHDDDAAGSSSDGTHEENEEPSSAPAETSEPESHESSSGESGGGGSE